MAHVERSERRTPSQPETRPGGVVLPFAAQDPVARRANNLTQLIESEIIPRLMVAHGCGSRPDGTSTRIPDALEIDTLAELAVGPDADGLHTELERLRIEGLSSESLLLDLISPAARRLGVLWERDQCSFADVSIGLCRLQQVIFGLSDPGVRSGSSDGRKALFAVTPGDQHGFAAFTVSEYFRRAGWDATCLTGVATDDLVSAVEDDWFDMIVFSMSDEKWLDRLPSIIADMRSRSRNRSIQVLVGGRVFDADPSRVATVGADFTAADPRAGLALAESRVVASRTVA
jgi:methanogenic corrinoid protein MtbC1